MLGVNTNAGAFKALQGLNATRASLEVSQTRLNTGKAVAGAKDNGATWAIAARQNTEARAIDAVKNSLDRAQGIVDVRMAAGDAVVDLLARMKEKALAASDTSISTASFKALNADFVSLSGQMKRSIEQMEVNGAIRIDGSTIASFISDTSGAAFDLTPRGVSPNWTGLGDFYDVTLDPATSGLPTGLNRSEHSKLVVTGASEGLEQWAQHMADLGEISQSIDRHRTFMGKLQDSLDTGVGNLVDADLARESAKLQALQSREQLAVRALSIANQSPSAVLSLFR